MGGCLEIAVSPAEQETKSPSHGASGSDAENLAHAKKCQLPASGQEDRVTVFASAEVHELQDTLSRPASGACDQCSRTGLHARGPILKLVILESLNLPFANEVQWDNGEWVGVEGGSLASPLPWG